MVLQGGLVLLVPADLTQAFAPTVAVAGVAPDNDPFQTLRLPLRNVPFAAWSRYTGSGLTLTGLGCVATSRALVYYTRKHDLAAPKPPSARPGGFSEPSRMADVSQYGA